MMAAQYRLPELDDKSFYTLEKRQMLNDTIVEYYMVHCLKELKPEKSELFHIFNPFFYKKLSHKHKSPDELDKLSRTWDKNIRLFDKKYLIIPVCSYGHWVLVIISHPSRVPVHDDPVCLSDKIALDEQPCLIIFDSLGYKHMSKFSYPFRKFLQFRWKYEKPHEEPRSFMNRTAFKDYSAKVPHQRNTYDCGIFLLHFFGQFIRSPRTTQHKILMEKELINGWLVNAIDLRDRIKSIIKNSNISLCIADDEESN